jgi:xylulokinase
MARILGLDLSTQGVTALVIDADAGVIVARSTVNFGADFPDRGHPSGYFPGAGDGEVHADPLLWVDGLQLVLDRLAEKINPALIAAVSVSGQQHGSVYLDVSWQDGLARNPSGRSWTEALRPHLTRSTSPIWMDNSTGEDCARISRALGGDLTVAKLTGSIPTPRFTGPQISRFARLEPSAWSRTGRVHLVSSFITSLLAGVDAPIDTGDGAGMNLMDLVRGAWSPEALATTAPDLARRLPAIGRNDAVVGLAAQWLVLRHGFSPRCQVVIGSGDNPSSLVGMGASTPGRIVVSLGTSDTLFAAIDGVRTDPDGFGHAFGNPLGGTMSLICVRNGSLARDAVRRELGLSDWDDFARAMSTSAPARSAVLPLEQDEITPRRKAGRLCVGAPVVGSSLALAAVEGQALNLRLHSRWIGTAPHTLRLTGGASENPAIAQVFADVFGVPVQRIKISDSAALGAAMRAAHSGLGITLSLMEGQFCVPESQLFNPRKELAPAYAVLEAELKALILR